MEEKELLKLIKEDDVKITLMIGRKDKHSPVANSTDGYRYIPYINQVSLSSLSKDIRTTILSMISDNMKKTLNSRINALENQLNDLRETENLLKNL